MATRDRLHEELKRVARVGLIPSELARRHVLRSEFPECFALRRVAATAGGYDITITARSAARGVWIDVGRLAAQLSDNAFDMVGGESVTVHVTTTVSLAELKKALRVRSYYSSAT